ncbi:hypothetical protein CEXT_522761, partial [Caerostris extrusa]
NQEVGKKSSQEVFLHSEVKKSSQEVVSKPHSVGKRIPVVYIVSIPQCFSTKQERSRQVKSRSSFYNQEVGKKSSQEVVSKIEEVGKMSIKSFVVVSTSKRQ